MSKIKTVKILAVGEVKENGTQGIKIATASGGPRWFNLYKESPKVPRGTKEAQIEIIKNFKGSWWGQLHKPVAEQVGQAEQQERTNHDRTGVSIVTQVVYKTLAGQFDDPIKFDTWLVKSLPFFRRHIRLIIENADTLYDEIREDDLQSAETPDGSQEDSNRGPEDSAPEGNPDEMEDIPF